MSKATLGYDFTEIYNQTNSHVAFSPGTHFILTAVQDRLIVRRPDTFQIARTWLLDNTPTESTAVIGSAGQPVRSKKAVDSDGWISHVGWSADSEHILAACVKRGVVHVLKMRDDTWHAKIEAGVEGLVKAEWAPDGRHILCFSEWGVCQIPDPSFSCQIIRVWLASSDYLVSCHRLLYVYTIPQIHGQSVYLSPRWAILRSC
jgi:hypothetical protein